MSDKIRIDYDQLEQIAATFANNAEIMQGTHGTIRNNIDALREGSWIGKGATAFYQEMDELVLPALSSLFDSLHEAHGSIKSAIRTYQAAEEDAAHLIGSSSVESGSSSASGNSQSSASPTASNNNATNMSDNGAKLIARYEGFSPQLYNDPAGHATIGYGHLVHLGPINGSEPEEFKNKISERRALELLHQDAGQAENAIHAMVKVPLNQNQFDALTSFVYNVGAGNFQNSDLLSKLNNGDYASVPSELKRWIHGSGKVLPGLVRRRDEEANLFVTQ